MADDPTAPAGPPKPEPAKPEKTFTQEELDRIVGERLAREKERVKDYDDLKAKAAKLDEIEQASASDLEKANNRAEKAEAERDEAIVRANDTLTRSAVVSAAAEKGAIVPGDVFTLLQGDTAFKEHKEKVTVGDDGQVTGAKDAVQAVLDARPNLVGQTHPGPGDGGARPPVTPSASSGDPEQEHNKTLAGLFGPT